MEEKIKSKRILCICNHGNVRSNALRHLIWKLNGKCFGTSEDYLKEYIKYEAINIGAHCSTDETLSLLINWCDIAIDLSDGDEKIQKKLKDIAKEKYIRFDIGIDCWGNPLHPELHQKLMPLIEKIKMEENKNA